MSCVHKSVTPLLSLHCFASGVELAMYLNMLKEDRDYNGAAAAAAQADSGAEEDQLKGKQAWPKSRYELQQPFMRVYSSDTRGSTVAYKAVLWVPNHLRPSATAPKHVVVGSR